MMEFKCSIGGADDVCAGGSVGGGGGGVVALKVMEVRWW